jgi:hypothetical protein
MWRLLTWDRAGQLGKSGGPSARKGRECDVESQHLQGCSPHLCRLRTNELAPVSKYWTYWSHAGVIGPLSWCSWLAINAWLYPYCFNGYKGERNWMGTRRSVSRRAGDVVRSSFFSGAVALSNAVDNAVKGCHIRGFPAGSVRVVYVD